MEFKCKDLVMWIIQNDLMDETIHVDSKDSNFITLEEAAVKLGVGTNSLLDMYKLGLISGLKLGDNIYFDKNIKL